MPIINHFAGGLNNRRLPQFTRTEEAFVYNNIDHSSGAIKSELGKVASGIMANEHCVYFRSNNEWVSFDAPTDSVEYRDILFYTDRVGAPRRYDGIVDTPLGLPTPGSFLYWAQLATIGPRNATVSVTLGDWSDGNSTINPPAGLLQIALVRRDSAATIPMSAARLLTVDKYGEVTEGPAGTGNLPDLPDWESINWNAGKGFTLDFEFHEDQDYGDGIEVYISVGDTFRRYRTYTAADTFTTHVPYYNAINAQPDLTEDDLPALFDQYQYVTTFWDETTSVESAPNPISPDAVGAIFGDYGGETHFSGLAIPDAERATHRRLYRIGNNLTDFSLVAEIPITQDTYEDRLRDDEIDGRILTTINDEPPLAGMSFLTEAYGMLFGALGSKLYFTPVGEPEKWPRTHFLDFSHDVTGIAPVANGIIVLTKYRAEILLGNSPTSFSVQSLAGDQGCLEHRSIQRIGAAAVWVSTDGLCISNGGPVKVMSKDKLGKVDLTVASSALWDEAYYLCQTDGTVLIASFAYGDVYKTLSDGFSQIYLGDDQLYGWANGELHELFTGPELEFKYVSPRFFEGGATRAKLYKNVYIHADGDIMVKVLINDELVQTKEFSGKDNFQIKVPQNCHRGHYIQFEITGTGVVNEIAWSASGANG